MNLSIDQVSNGFIVEQQETQLVFTTFEALSQHLKNKLCKKAKPANDNVIPIEVRAPWAFKEGTD